MRVFEEEEERGEETKAEAEDIASAGKKGGG